MNQTRRNLLQIARSSDWLASFKRPDKTLIDIQPYIYNGSIQATAAAAAGQVSIPIQADSDFVMFAMTGAVINNATGGFILNPYETIQVTDTGSGKTFFSDYTLFGLVFGLAGFPYMLATPRVVAPNTNILVQINNLSALTYNTYIAFAGARLYYQS